MTRLRLANLTASDPAGQIRQLADYLRYLVGELNGMLDEMERAQSGGERHGK